ncbi:hypothetical protein GCM10023200_37310 [Actinomycetospora chlora]|uniref:TNase-like domain-containing protein n=1 Tax=Actinomycetospora chlora TaxID=663608 RepID=A0ABP9BM78_9PSEU
MRTAYKVWLGIAAVVFLLVAARDLGSGARPASSSTPIASPATTSTTTSSTSRAPVSSAAPTTSSASAEEGEPATVTDVVDGDTLEIEGGRRVRLLGIDACEMGTRGGREAKDLLETYVSSSRVRLIADGPRDTDRYGRLLRRVETTGSTDVGALLVSSPSVGIYEGGRNDASPAYLAELRAADHGDRDCAGTPDTAPTGSGGDVDVDVHVGDGDSGLPDGALTGGYCARKWWC